MVKECGLLLKNGSLQCCNSPVDGSAQAFKYKIYFKNYKKDYSIGKTVKYCLNLSDKTCM